MLRKSFIILICIFFQANSAQSSTTVDPLWEDAFSKARIAYLAGNYPATKELLESALENISYFENNPNEKTAKALMARPRIRLMLYSLYNWDLELQKSIDVLEDYAKDFYDHGEGKSLSYWAFLYLCEIKYTSQVKAVISDETLCENKPDNLRRLRKTHKHLNNIQRWWFDSDYFVQDATDLKLNTSADNYYIYHGWDIIDPFYADLLIGVNFSKAGSTATNINNPDPDVFNSEVLLETSVSVDVPANIFESSLFKYYLEIRPGAVLVNQSHFLISRSWHAPVQKGTYAKFKLVDVNGTEHFEEFLIARKGDTVITLRIVSYEEESTDFEKALSKFIKDSDLDLNNHFESLFKVRETGKPFCNEEEAENEDCIKPKVDYFAG